MNLNITVSFVVKDIPIIQDITERHLAEQMLKESEASLKELNATKDKLFSIIAHDLRSPFTGILGFSELLKENLKESTISQSEKYFCDYDCDEKTLSKEDLKKIYDETTFTTEQLKNKLK